ncbi:MULTISPECIES: glycosyltransferase [Bartonella]|uniref:glycosyltransferase family 2 protein n=1 Tax=Bartonella TaxID=773 RepID=UPI0018DAFFCC|nr:MULTISPECIES: glycosyltransferase [Bartonella]MBH9974723.1 glycosyltransferase [Bartonella choladocola]MBI0014329.1 glycosyltransferase [Bartonella sp. B10834G3]
MNSKKNIQNSSIGGVMDVSIICATIERPDLVERFINSVRKFYQDIPIIIGDQSRDQKKLESFYKKNKAQCLRLPFDCGVAYARNECVKAVKTKFILLCDDDFVFTDETDINIPLQALKKFPEIGIVTGAVIDHHKAGSSVYFQKRYYEKFIYLDKERKTFCSVPISYIKPHIYETPGHTFFQCDIGLNFAVMRKDIFKDGIEWDSRFKCNGEHEDFYLNLKYNSHWKVAYTPEFYCNHEHLSNSTYVKLRDRQDGWLEFGKKWGIEQHLEFGYGLRNMSSYLSGDRHRELITSAESLPIYKERYMRIFPNGDCVASDVMNVISAEYSADELVSSIGVSYKVLIKDYHKFQNARSTITWKIFRPMMRLEGTIRKLLGKVTST